MQTRGIVKIDDVVGHVVYCFNVVGVIALPNSFHLQVREEALHRGVVPAICFSAHAGDQAVPMRKAGVFGAGLAY